MSSDYLYSPSHLCLQSADKIQLLILLDVVRLPPSSPSPEIYRPTLIPLDGIRLSPLISFPLLPVVYKQKSALIPLDADPPSPLGAARPPGLGSFKSRSQIDSSWPLLDPNQFTQVPFPSKCAGSVKPAGSFLPLLKIQVSGTSSPLH
jgi:hypothetical protein